MGLFNAYTIDIKRKTQTGTSVSGQPIYSESTVYSSIKADIQENTSKITYSEAGQTTVADKVLILETAVTKPKDIVVDKSTGDKYIVAGVAYKGVILPHYQVPLKYGTEQ